MNPIHRLRRALYAPLSVGPPREPLPKLFFLHVPKCGGTSVGGAFRRAYEARGLATAHLDAVASARAAEAVGLGLRAYRNALLPYFLTSEPLRYLDGHFSFDRKAWDALGGAWKAVTLLRDPVERWFSNYFYNRYQDESKRNFRMFAPLPEFLETPQARGLGVAYVSFFANVEGVEAAAQPEAVARALEALEAFTAVGLLERLDGFIRDVEAVLGFRPEVQHLRKGPPAEGLREEVTDEVRARVRELCAPSLQVYDVVRSALDRRGSWLAVTGADLAPAPLRVP